MAPDERWLAVRVEPSADRQSVIDALFAAGSQGIQEAGNAIVTHFPPGTDATSIERAIHEVDPDSMVSVELAPAADWSEWRASVGEHRLGRVTITPPWIEGSDDSIRIVIDPAMAFGTGEHATTRGVIRLMQKLERVPEKVADLGSGSAVLAVCAAKLGARNVAAVELDPDAIGNAEENIEVNNVTDAVHVIQGDASLLMPLIAPVDLILANIISSVLIELLPVMAESLSPGGYAILSGILAEEREMMLGVLLAGGWVTVDEDLEENWWSVMITRQ
ncbi:MAG TPA: 50S ribosomal protein L11 methyltransferase [Gemmatimonadaceae bacterium]